MPTAAASVCNAALGFVLVAYRLGPMQQCKVRCDGTCSGYGDLNDTHCAVCTVDPRESPTLDFGNASFVEWVPQTKSHKGCQSNNQCLACPQLKTLRVRSNTHVLLSKSCTHYDPHDDPSMFDVKLDVVPGARNVRIVGKGTVTSDVWPLQLRPPLLIGNKVRRNDFESHDPEVLFALQEDQKASAAVRITEKGKVRVSAAAPQFKVLIVIAGMKAKPLELHKASYIEGYAGEAIAGLGHVTGSLKLACLNESGSNASVPNQHYVIQELMKDTVKITPVPDAPCTDVNLTRLLGYYGSEYEELFYDDEGTDVPPWREVRTAATVAIVLLLVLFMSNQPDITTKKTN